MSKMNLFSALYQEVRQYLWPQYTPPVRTDYFYRQPATTGSKANVVEFDDPHRQFVGYNPSGAVVKATELKVNGDGSTEFATIKTFTKGKADQVNVSPALTTLDLEELARRKPTVPQDTALIFKAAYAERKGNTTASELALITGFSKSYAEVALSSFRAALLRERGQNAT